MSTSSQPDPLPALLRSQHLSGGPAGETIIHDLSFAWWPGLHWVCGDEGSGKTSLLRLLAGDLPALKGIVDRPPGGVFWVDLKGSEHDQTPVQACWDRLQALYPNWQHALKQDLIEALDMERHRHKPLFMLSTGSRRKVMLVAALASGASVTLLDQPFVSLDHVSVRAIKDFLSDAAAHPSRAWIVADYEVPQDLTPNSVLDLSPHTHRP
jgi:ABC-type multidrug transport system ATPase subunit